MDKEKAQFSNKKMQYLYEDIQLKNITSLIDKCNSKIKKNNNVENIPDIPDKFENIIITSDEYNTLLYVRTKLKSLSESSHIEKPLASLKNYFATTSKEQQDKDWEELKHLNEIDDDGTLEYMLKEEMHLE